MSYVALARCFLIYRIHEILCRSQNQKMKSSIILVILAVLVVYICAIPVSFPYNTESSSSGKQSPDLHHVHRRDIYNPFTELELRITAFSIPRIKSDFGFHTKGRLESKAIELTTGLDVGINRN